MNVKEYIESGAIEAYVLGLASAEEAAEMEQLRKQYAEVNDAIIAFEMQLQQSATANAEPAPAEVKQTLFATLSNEFSVADNGNGKLVSLEKATAATVKPVWKYLAAASVILLLVSAASNVYFYNKYQLTSKEYQNLLAQQTEFAKRAEVMQTELKLKEYEVKLMSDPATVKVPMSPVPGKQGLLATVYWDSKTKDVYVHTNALPRPQTGKQYQLWALVDGQPVDAGVMDACTGLCKMKNIQKAQAFAITLEQSGGSTTPHLDQLQVMGNVGS